ncbi:hypothetical protein [Dyadobacter sp. CY343]|uniref:hypothetical protein n=1 Tax=Dyadobacter sp. CY343 TaxID=2907299 RepID=UPI001F3F1A8E|nr:hypothetical protein [Dyadobacter sp. CY343]MCE7059782.1 hypothetical protein [Dyadobacter sp. CY343]
MILTLNGENIGSAEMTTGKYQNLKFAFVVFATLVSSHLFAFHGVNGRIFDVLEIVVVVACIGILIVSKDRSPAISIFGTNVKLFLIIPLISALGAAAFHGQELHWSVSVIRTNFFWLLYFVVRVFNIDTKRIVYLIATIGVIWCIITIVQQFTYPMILFYNRDGEDGQELLRGNIYRFMIDPHYFGVFMTIYFYCESLRKQKFVYMLFVLLGLAGLYYFGTRQVAAAVLGCMAIFTLSLKGRTQIMALGVALALSCFAYAFSDVLFGSFVELTNDQLNSNEDDIRNIAADFFLFDYWPHWMTVFTGNGMENHNSHYGMEMLRMNQELGLYRSDVGLIGAFNLFGIFYVINILWVNIKGISSRYYTGETKYLRLFFVYSLVLVWISEHYSYAAAIPFFCFLFYLVEWSYTQKIMIRTIEPAEYEHETRVAEPA